MNAGVRVSLLRRWLEYLHSLVKCSQSVQRMTCSSRIRFSEAKDDHSPRSGMCVQFPIGKNRSLRGESGTLVLTYASVVGRL
jgi:hypothetical protein